MRTTKTILNSLLSLFFPETCCACGNPIVEGETFICLHCLCKLPLTGYHQHLSNPAEERFRGKFEYEKIASFLHFEKGGHAQKIVHQIKYKNNEVFGIWLGQCMAEEIAVSDFFSEIDLIVPIPLHKKKRKKRGYNQAEALASGISQKLGIPCNIENLQKIKANTSQTKKGRYERWLNSLETFMVRDTEIFANKHILLIDDVITTGATIESCVHCIQSNNNTKISVLTLAISH